METGQYARFRCPAGRQSDSRLQRAGPEQDGHFNGLVLDWLGIETLASYDASVAVSICCMGIATPSRNDGLKRKCSRVPPGLNLTGQDQARDETHSGPQNKSPSRRGKKKTG
jgi:hypothetical protein